MVRNEDFSSLKKAIKGKKKKKHKKEIKNNFPKLTYKDWDFFFIIVALVFRVPEHVDLKKQPKKKTKKT